MPKSPTYASQIAELRARYEAGRAREQREIVRELWYLCLGKAAATRVALPWLGELATHRDVQIVGYATELLGRGGVAGQAMARRLLTHRREDVRCKAAYGLGNGVATAPAPLKKLVAMTSAASDEESSAGFHALGKISDYSERAGLLVPYQRKLIAAFDGAGTVVRSWAAEALVGAFRSPKQFVEFALPRLDPARGNPEPVLLEALVEALGKVNARPYLPTVLRLVRAKPAWIGQLLPVLSHAGPDARDIVPLLEPLAEGDSLDALQAGAALLRIDGRPDVLRKLRRQLPRSPDEIAGILCGIGPAAAPVIGTLARVIDERFDEPDWDLLWALTDALAAIAVPDPITVRALRKALSHESGRVAGSALRGLGKLGPSARAALPDLRRLEREFSGASRRRVQHVIGLITAPAHGSHRFGKS
jgi:HEAT repeat protein